MKTGICIHDIGTNVHLDYANSLSGIITGICIRGDGTQVSYEVSYFSGGDYKQIWMIDKEFTVTDGPSMVTIGFLNGRQ